MTTHITAKSEWFHWDLKGLWKYRELIRLFAKKSLTVTYKQTVLGPLWLIVNPLLSSFVYLVLFGRIAALGTEGIPQFLFYLSTELHGRQRCHTDANKIGGDTKLVVSQNGRGQLE